MMKGVSSRIMKKISVSCEKVHMKAFVRDLSPIKITDVNGKIINMQTTFANDNSGTSLITF